MTILHKWLRKRNPVYIQVGWFNKEHSVRPMKQKLWPEDIPVYIQLEPGETLTKLEGQ